MTLIMVNIQKIEILSVYWLVPYLQLRAPSMDLGTYIPSVDKSSEASKMFRILGERFQHYTGGVVRPEDITQDPEKKCMYAVCKGDRKWLAVIASPDGVAMQFCLAQLLLDEKDINAYHLKQCISWKMDTFKKDLNYINFMGLVSDDTEPESPPIVVKDYTHQVLRAELLREKSFCSTRMFPVRP
jgi:hypothetical protein